MKQIGKIGKEKSASENCNKLQKKWGWEEKKALILTKYGNAHSFALVFNPSVQVKCAANIERALTGDAPTIRQLRHTYSLEQIQVWIVAHLEDLNRFAGVKEKMTIPQMMELAVIIILKSDYLKASEILLFFYKLKAGDLGLFYGVVDPQKVADYLNVFITWRSNELAKLKTKNMQIALQRSREAHRKNAITREEYEERKRLRALSKTDIKLNRNEK